MLRLILIALLLVIPTHASAVTVRVMGGTAAAAPDYTDITMWLSFENCGGTPCQTDYTLAGDDYSAGDSVAAKGSAAEVNSACAKVGTYGASFPTGNDSYTFDVSTSDIVSGSSGVIAFWWKQTTWTNASFITSILDSGTGSIKTWTYESTEHTIRAGVNDGTAYTWTDPDPQFPIVADTWYFIQLVYDATTDLMKMQIADADDVAWTEMINSTATGYNAITPATFVLGTAGGGSYICIDNLMVSDDITRDFFSLRNETTSPR